MTFDLNLIKKTSANTKKQRVNASIPEKSLYCNIY